MSRPQEWRRNNGPYLSFETKNNPSPAKDADTQRKAEGSILSDNTPATAGTKTPPTISPNAVIKPMPFAFK